MTPHQRSLARALYFALAVILGLAIANVARAEDHDPTPSPAPVVLVFTMQLPDGEMAKFLTPFSTPDDCMAAKAMALSVAAFASVATCVTPRPPGLS